MVAKIFLKTTYSDAEKNLKWLPLHMRRDMHTVTFHLKVITQHDISTIYTQSINHVSKILVKEQNISFIF